MFFWGMLTGCAVVIVGSVLASLFIKWQDKKKGKKNNANQQNKKGDN